MFYDPMISKLICYGKDRDAAINKLIESLKNYQVVGMPTNIEFVEKCADHPAFRAGGVDTGFLEIYADDVAVTENNTGSPVARALASAALLAASKDRATPPSAYSDLANFRVHGEATKTFKWVPQRARRRAGGSGAPASPAGERADVERAGAPASDADERAEGAGERANQPSSLAHQPTFFACAPTSSFFCARAAQNSLALAPSPLPLLTPKLDVASPASSPPSRCPRRAPTRSRSRAPTRLSPCRCASCPPPTAQRPSRRGWTTSASSPPPS
jgi:hypothetical protein